VIAGHFGLAAAVKAKTPAVPLWSLMLASQWLDVVFVPLLVTGAERLAPIPGSRPGAYGSAVIYADYTHSLLGAIVLAALFGAVAAVRLGKASGAVLAAVVFSHWLLDLPMHRRTCRSSQATPWGFLGSAWGCGSTPRYPLPSSSRSFSSGQRCTGVPCRA
jgi:hypothetical protein